MPRRKMNTVTTEPWPALREGRLYQARIKIVTPGKAASFLRVTLENLDSDQLGRIHEVKLPLPVRPGNRVCAFLAVCGIDATAVGTTVDLDRIVTTIVGMRFRGLGADGVEEFDFEPIMCRPVTKDAETGKHRSTDTATQPEEDPGSV